MSALVIVTFSQHPDAPLINGVANMRHTFGNELVTPSLEPLQQQQLAQLRNPGAVGLHM